MCVGGGRQGGGGAEGRGVKGGNLLAVSRPKGGGCVCGGGWGVGGGGGGVVWCELVVEASTVHCSTSHRGVDVEVNVVASVKIIVIFDN